MQLQRSAKIRLYFLRGYRPIHADMPYPTWLYSILVYTGCIRLQLALINLDRLIKLIRHTNDTITLYVVQYMRYHLSHFLSR